MLFCPEPHEEPAPDPPQDPFPNSAGKIYEASREPYDCEPPPFQGKNINAALLFLSDDAQMQFGILIVLQMPADATRLADNFQYSRNTQDAIVHFGPHD